MNGNLRRLPKVVSLVVFLAALVRADGYTQRFSTPYPVVTAEEHDRCVREVVIAFQGDDPDASMRAAAARLRDDERFETVRTRTPQEAYEEFARVFAEQPDMVRLAGPESFPPSVLAMVRKGNMAARIENALRDEFPDGEVIVQRWCPQPVR